MTLKLAMIRCPDDVAPETREVHGGEFSIGRGKDNEWVVADTDRHLSKRHCQFVYGGGEWEVHDLSTNGTYLNDAGDPIGKGASQKLSHGDRVKFGLYELEVTLDEDPAAGSQGGFPAYNWSRSAEPLSRAESPSYHGGGLHESASLTDQRNSPILPPDFDPLAPAPEPFAGTQPDHAPALQSAFRPPQPLSIIPEDWDVAPPSASAPPPSPRAPTMPAPQEARVPPPAPVPDVPPRPTTRALPPSRTANDTDVTAALLRGLGLAEATLSDPEKTMERLGAAARATVSGLRQILMARASIKEEFRIEQTVIRASGNNPLKFSIDDDDALATLLGIGRSASMPASQAIAEAFEDLRLHELATISAMQAAVRTLLAQFDPQKIERAAANSGGLQLYPAQTKARAWDDFARLHGQVTQALSDDFDSVFGKAFARAYEQAIDKLDAEKETS